MTRGRAQTARLERAMIAGILAYALVFQMVIGALANGAALGHALAGDISICNGALPPTSAGGPLGRPVSRELCCVVPAVTAAVPPALAEMPAPRIVLADVLVAPSASGIILPVTAPGQARAPPAAA